MTDTDSDKSRECVRPGHRQHRRRLVRRHGRLRDDRPVGDQRDLGRRAGGCRPSSPALFLLFLLVVLRRLVGASSRWPALVAVMIMVSIGTFSWNSILNLRAHPPPSSVVMLATVVTVVATHDLAQGVLVGVLLSGIFFAGKVRAHVPRSSAAVSHDGADATYAGQGQMFFASAERFTRAFDFDGARPTGCDRRQRRALLGHLGRRRARQGRAEVRAATAPRSRSSASTRPAPTMVDRFAVHDKTGAVEQLGCR